MEVLCLALRGEIVGLEDCVSGRIGGVGIFDNRSNLVVRLDFRDEFRPDSNFAEIRECYSRFGKLLRTS